MSPSRTNSSFHTGLQVFDFVLLMRSSPPQRSTQYGSDLPFKSTAASPLPRLSVSRSTPFSLSRSAYSSDAPAPATGATGAAAEEGAASAGAPPSVTSTTGVTVTSSGMAAPAAAVLGDDLCAGGSTCVTVTSRSSAYATLPRASE